MNDATAIAAMRVIKQNKLRIPEDISIIGFRNDLSSELVDPGLTTVIQPTFDIGREAARLVLKEISAEGNASATKANHKTVVLKIQFIVRESA